MKRTDEVSVWAVAIANLPVTPSNKVVNFMRWVSKLKGFIAISPQYPNGTLILFKFEEYARAAREEIANYPGYESGVGDNVTEIYVKKEYLRPRHDKRRGRQIEEDY